jgi:GDP-L-fucose synthase
MSSVVVTGGSGLLGRTLQGLKPEWTYLSSSDANLCDRNQTEEVLSGFDTVIHLAARVGGIVDNTQNPYPFFSDNISMGLNVVDHCVQNNKYLINMSSTCVYPKDAPYYPMTENLIEHGPPEPTNQYYAYAKRSVYHLLSAARNLGHRSCTLFLSNLYGDFDHFDDNVRSHLVAALIRKFSDAVDCNSDVVELLGDGTPERQFTHAEDAARAIALIESHRPNDDYNFSTPENLTVREIANIVQNAVGFSGDVSYNGQLNGLLKKEVCSKKFLDTFGEFEFTPLNEGIERVVNLIGKV